MTSHDKFITLRPLSELIGGRASGFGMRVVNFAISATATIAMAGSALAADPLTKKGADPKQVVCKVERFVGSNLKNRVCKTRAEWQAVAEDTKQALDDRFMKDKGPKQPGIAQ